MTVHTMTNIYELLKKKKISQIVGSLNLYE